MSLAVPLAGYFLAVLVIMFGGRKRRSFAKASQTAAGIAVTAFCVGAIVWFLSAVIWQLINAEN